MEVLPLGNTGKGRRHKYSRPTDLVNDLLKSSFVSNGKKLCVFQTKFLKPLKGKVLEVTGNLESYSEK